LRSEERSGVIAIILLFLWGLPLSLPFRYYAQILYDSFAHIFEKIYIEPHRSVGTTLILLSLTAITIVLLLITKTEAGKYIGAICACVSLLVFVFSCLNSGTVDIVMATVLISIVLAMILLILFKMNKILIWISDVFVYSIPISLIAGLVFRPLFELGKAWKYIAYAGRYCPVNIAYAYNKLMSLPALVWGLFFAILLTFPVIYYSFSRKKG